MCSSVLLNVSVKDGNYILHSRNVQCVVESHSKDLATHNGYVVIGDESSDDEDESTVLSLWWEVEKA